jgi:predicted nucleic acid-binding protein
MIVLETNVLSAIMKPEFNAPAIEWLDRQDQELLRMTVVSLEELAYGLCIMPNGRRRAALTAGLTALQVGPLGTRMLMLTTEAAHQSAIARAAAVKAIGHCDVRDALIAGIALANGASVATRNVDHFKLFGVPIVDPWA